MAIRNTRPNPYVGPRAFETGETLYGRDLELRQLLDLLISERIVLLHSPSGAGKSSLIQAKLIPRLQDEEFCVLPVARSSVSARICAFLLPVLRLKCAKDSASDINSPSESQRKCPSLTNC